MRPFCCPALYLPIVLLTGCSGNDSSVDRRAEAPMPVAAPVESTADEPSQETGRTGPFEKKVSVGTFQVPEGWKEIQPQNPDFLEAEFQLTGTGGDARLTLSSAGGSTDANIERWIGQFQTDAEPLRESVQADGVEVAIVDVRGTFTGGFGSSPQPDSRLLGAVVPLGSRSYFIKLTGPRETVAEHKDAFLQFVRSARFSR